MDDLTVLLGANDTGKSTLLRALRNTLAYVTSPGDTPPVASTAFFVTLSEDERAYLSGFALASRRIVSDDFPFGERDEEFWERLGQPRNAWPSPRTSLDFWRFGTWDVDELE